jgi:hypothetical protein
MKNLILSVTLSFNVMLIFAQTPLNFCGGNHAEMEYLFTFNTVPDSSVYYIKIDTNQLNNIWQTGVVNKSYFKSGLDGPRALVTDTVHPYPVNNLSSFIFSVINCKGGANYSGMVVAFYFSINSDSLRDGGTVEVSHNNGLNWINIILDTNDSPKLSGFYSVNDTIKSLGKPGFSGTYRNSYVQIEYNANRLLKVDTITFKFTFGSDSIQTNKDGWMIGEISSTGIFEGIDEKFVNDLISIFPNPAIDKITIETSGVVKESYLEIVNIEGQKLMTSQITQSQTQIDISSLPSGVYFVRLTNDKTVELGKFVKQ